MHRFGFIVLLSVCAVALPARAGVALDLDPNDTGIANVSLSTQPSMSFRVGGFSTLGVYIVLQRANATDVKMVCTGGPTLDLQAPIGVATVDSYGGITMAKAAWTYPVTGSALLRIQIAPINDNFVRCVFMGTGASSGDKLTVYARLGGTP